jgi:hypothetical protein
MIYLTHAQHVTGAALLCSLALLAIRNAVLRQIGRRSR